ncbi:hypothetical protein MUGA111182_17315 [Mucilaginibacter galii]|uniref:hypothetical protein n=1 Tax=Mucilaginibacter galii TaxID=2005073 RepID=UPI00166C3D6C|nr:hypothetical protein [Mucilaginibacter galii]
MKAISPSNLSPQNVEPRNNDNNLYLVAMLITAVLLFGVAYYDQVLSHFIR